jgi:hypothetical protein
MVRMQDPDFYRNEIGKILTNCEDDISAFLTYVKK